jgi:hypothetical protein
MGPISPLGALFALIIVGVTIEAVEQQSKDAAYALVLVVLLAMITFNAKTFRQQLELILGVLSTAPAQQKAAPMDKRGTLV